MLSQWWHWITGVGFKVNLASWKDGDLFFFPLYTMMSLMQEALSLFSHLILLRRGFIQILLAQSSAQKTRNGGEFQQRGQKNTANSLQMCLGAVWGNTVLPSLEGKRTLHWRKFNELRAKNIGDPVQLVLTVCLVFQPRERRQHWSTFRSLEELSVCRITGVYVSHPQSKKHNHILVKKVHLQLFYTGTKSLTVEWIKVLEGTSGDKTGNTKEQPDSRLMLLWFSLERFLEPFIHFLIVGNWLFISIQMHLLVDLD